MLDAPFSFTRRDAVKLTAFVLLATLGFGIVLGMIIAISRLIGGGIPPGLAGNPTFISIGNVFGFGLVITLALRRAHTPWRQFVRLGPLAPAVLACLLVALCGLTIIISEIDNAIYVLVPRPAWLGNLFGGLGDLATHPVAAPFALLVMAPVTEEFFFRGLILRRLLASVTPWRAIWTSSLLFAAIHLNPWQAPVAILTGLVLGWVYARTRSLALCLAGHAFVNGLALLLPGLFFTVEGFNQPHAAGPVHFQPWWFDLTGLALVGAGLYALARQLPPLPAAPAHAEPPPLVLETTAT